MACCINCFCMNYEETPCNATILLINKVITVLRLLIGLSAFLKLDHLAQWDWSTTFWPYWCSFAIQAIMAVASLIIFVNTVFNFFKEEAIVEDSKLTHILIKYSLGLFLGIYSDKWVRHCHFHPDYRYNTDL